MMKFYSKNGVHLYETKFEAKVLGWLEDKLDALQMLQDILFHAAVDIKNQEKEARTQRKEEAGTNPPI